MSASLVRNGQALHTGSKVFSLQRIKRKVVFIAFFFNHTLGMPFLVMEEKIGEKVKHN